MSTVCPCYVDPAIKMISLRLAVALTGKSVNLLGLFLVVSYRRMSSYGINQVTFHPEIIITFGKTLSLLYLYDVLP